MARSPVGEGMTTRVKQESELLGLVLGKDDAGSSSVWGCIRGWAGAGGRGTLYVCFDNF